MLIKQLWNHGKKLNMYIFPIDMGFDLVCAKFGGITRDLVWLLDDFVLEPSENLNNFSQIDFADSINFKQV